MEISTLRTGQESYPFIVYEKLPTTEEEVEELVSILTGQDERSHNLIFPLKSSYGRQIFATIIAFKDEGVLADQSILKYVFNWTKNYLRPVLPNRWAAGLIPYIFSFGGEHPVLDRHFFFFLSLTHFTGSKEFSLKSFKPLERNMIGKN